MSSEPSAVTSAQSSYWDGFYSAPHPDIAEPTTFAVHVEPQLARGSFVFELGCGNGRDAVYFARRGHRVAACDLSHVAVDRLRQQIGTMQGLQSTPEIIVADFAELGDQYAGQIDAIYARFTLHAIPVETEGLVLGWVSRNLRPGGRLHIEARSVLGDLYGRGESAGEDAFIHDGHYRRFLRRDVLVHSVERHGLVVDDVVEAAGLAVYLDDDPVVIRLVARR